MLLLMRIARVLHMTRLIHPLVRPTLKRRRQWRSADEARDYLRGRKIYNGWTDEALQAYVDYALQSDDSGVVRLRCDPQTEAKYFATIPNGLWTALENIECHTTCIMGENTFPFALEASHTAAQGPGNISRTLVPGGHCYMQQNPHNAAQHVKAAIKAI